MLNQILQTRGKKPTVLDNSAQRLFDSYLYDYELIYMACLTFLHHLSHRHLVDIGHVTQYGKYGKAC